MNELLANLRSPTWWISVVVFGLVLGVISSLLASYWKPRLDRLLAQRSDRARERADARAESHRRELEALKGSAHFQLLASETISRRTISGLLYMGFSLMNVAVGGFAMGAGFPLWMILGLLFIAFSFGVRGMVDLTTAKHQQRQLRQALTDEHAKLDMDAYV